MPFDYERSCIASNAEYTLAKWQIVGLGIALLAVIVLVCFGMRKVLLGPLAVVIGHIREIADGNLTDNIVAVGRNEISELTAGVKHMQQELIITVGSVREGSDAIYSGATVIAAGNNDLSSRTEQQAAALEEQASLLTQAVAAFRLNNQGTIQRQTAAPALSPRKPATDGRDDSWETF